MKLPLWRLIAAFCVLAGMLAVLMSLAPVYFENYRLEQYLRKLAREPDAAGTSDEKLRSEVLARAHELDLPVQSSDVQITHSQSKVQLQMKYAVQINFSLYQVDLHFHPSAASR